MSAQDKNTPGLRPDQAAVSDESIQRVHTQLAHNRPEPKEGYSPMPLFLLGLVSSLIFVVAIYFVHNRGGFDPLAYDERYDPALAKPAAKKEVDPIAEGKKLYGQICFTCHQPTGLGIPNTYPPLAKSEWVNGTEDRIIRILLNGLGGPVKVEGNTFNGAMPAFGPGSGYNWTDEKISYVLSYVRQEWGNAAPIVTPEKVNEIRTKAAAGRTSPWTEAELLAVP